MKTDYLMKNIIYDEFKIFDLISTADLEKIKNEQLTNELIDILLAETFTDSSIDAQELNKFLICSPDLTKKLVDMYLDESEESKSDLLSKFQMTNIMNKQFLFFFKNNTDEHHSQLIIIKNLSNLIDLILMRNTNQEITDNSNKKYGFSFIVVNVYYNMNDDSLGDIVFKCKKGKKIDVDLTSKFLKNFLMFLIDTKDDAIIKNICNVIDDQKDLIHRIELKTNNENDICVLCCAAFDEIINHVIFFDDCINEINLLQILNDNYCTRYREKKYKEAFNLLKKNNAAIIKSNNLFLKGQEKEYINSTSLTSHKSPNKAKVNVTKALDKLISKNLNEPQTDIKKGNEAKHTFKKINEITYNHNYNTVKVKSLKNFINMSANKTNIPAARLSNIKKNSEDIFINSRDLTQSSFAYTTNYSKRSSMQKNFNNKIPESPFKKCSPFKSLNKIKNSLTINLSPSKNFASDLSKKDSVLDLTKCSIETKDHVFDNTNFLSSSRNTYNTLQTSIDPNFNTSSNKKNKIYNSNRNSEIKFSPMKIIDKLCEDDLGIDEGVDLKAISLKFKRDQKQRNNIKLEKFVKEIELKEEKSKDLLNNENQQTKPCCNESECIIF